jgi:hypothetical protein
VLLVFVSSGLNQRYKLAGLGMVCMVKQAAPAHKSVVAAASSVRALKAERSMLLCVHVSRRVVLLRGAICARTPGAMWWP